MSRVASVFRAVPRLSEYLQRASVTGRRLPVRSFHDSSLRNLTGLQRARVIAGQRHCLTSLPVTLRPVLAGTTQLRQSFSSGGKDLSLDEVRGILNDFIAAIDDNISIFDGIANEATTLENLPDQWGEAIRLVAPLRQKVVAKHGFDDSNQGLQQFAQSYMQVTFALDDEELTTLPVPMKHLASVVFGSDGYINQKKPGDPASGAVYSMKVDELSHVAHRLHQLMKGRGWLEKFDALCDEIKEKEVSDNVEKKAMLSRAMVPLQLNALEYLHPVFNSVGGLVSFLVSMGESGSRLDPELVQKLAQQQRGFYNAVESL